MKKLHIALSTHNIAASVTDYTQRLGLEPCCYIEYEFALWRTDCLNLSIRYDAYCKKGTLRHLGWEDPDTAEFCQETDAGGIVWEQFTAQQQADEINEIWPDTNYTPR
ncbi:MAG: VOC family protein [Pseudomonadota bacterium]